MIDANEYAGDLPIELNTLIMNDFCLLTTGFNRTIRISLKFRPFFDSFPGNFRAEKRLGLQATLELMCVSPRTRLNKQGTTRRK